MDTDASRVLKERNCIGRSLCERSGFHRVQHKLNDFSAKHVIAFATILTDLFLYAVSTHLSNLAEKDSVVY